jgi:hypothetical protein
VCTDYRTVVVAELIPDDDHPAHHPFAVVTAAVYRAGLSSEEGGAPELLEELTAAIFGPGTGFPPPDAPPGYLTRITIEKVGGVGPWAS